MNGKILGKNRLSKTTSQQVEKEGKICHALRRTIPRSTIHVRMQSKLTTKWLNGGYKLIRFSKNAEAAAAAFAVKRQKTNKEKGNSMWIVSWDAHVLFHPHQHHHHAHNHPNIDKRKLCNKLYIKNKSWYTLNCDTRRKVCYETAHTHTNASSLFFRPMVS